MTIGCAKSVVMICFDCLHALAMLFTFWIKISPIQTSSNLTLFCPEFGANFNNHLFPRRASVMSCLQTKSAEWWRLTRSGATSRPAPPSRTTGRPRGASSRSTRPSESAPAIGRRSRPNRPPPPPLHSSRPTGPPMQRQPIRQAADSNRRQQSTHQPTLTRHKVRKK